MGNIIKKADNLGEEFEINYGRTKRLQTVLGGVITLLSFLLITFSSSIFIARYRDTSGPEVSISNEFDPKYPKVNLIEGKIFPILGIAENEVKMLDRKDLSKYVTIISTVYSIYYETLDDPAQFTPLAQIEYKPCPEVNHPIKQQIYGNYKNPTDFGEIYGLCPDVKNDSIFYVEGHLVTPPKTVFDIKVYPCTLDDQTQCKTVDEMRSLEFYFLLPKLSFNRGDYEKPVRTSPDVEFAPGIDTNQKQKFVIRLMKTRIFDDRIDFKEPILKETFIEIESTKKSTFSRSGKGVTCKKSDFAIFPPSCIPYLQFEFNAGGRSVVIYRSYTKLLDLLGEI